MIETPDLICTLAAKVGPVTPLAPPGRRLCGWLLLAVALTGLLAMGQGLRADLADELRKPAFVLALGAALLTGALAGAGCLLASLPDRSRRWLWLPVPPAAVWVSMLSYGCLADWVSLDPASLEWPEALHCLSTLLLTSVPLSLALFMLLRHAARLRPALVTMTAGLAVSAITSATMSVIHQIDASVMILAWNLGAAALLVLFDGAAGQWILARLAPHSGL